MNQKYELVEIESLLFVRLKNHLCLLDTASPFSYFKKGFEVIDGIEYKSNALFTEILSTRMAELSAVIKKRFKITGIIGTDIILTTGITIYKKEGYVVFQSNELDTKLELDFKKHMVKNQGYIVFPNLFITGMTQEGYHPIVLDTGACVSVLRGSLCTHAQYAYRRDYYYPSLGRVLNSDFMFFTLEDKTQIRIVAASNRDTDIDSQFDFIGVDGELCFHDFGFEVLSINIEAKKISWI